MFASMRRYRVQPESLQEFVRRVDATFADQIAARDGFVSYELIDCGEGDLFTLSIFDEIAQAEASRDLARSWTERELADIDHTRFDAVHGESLISRAGTDHPGSVSIRLYKVGAGDMSQLLHKVDQRARSMGAFHLLDCGDQELLWVSFVDGNVEAADTRVARFMADELAEFRPAYVVSIRGDVAVSRGGAAAPTGAGR